jgi:hypothetical protein
MFSFFKKKSAKNYGTFSAYGMEEVYHFLSENRISERVKELSGKPNLGTSFEDFVSHESVKSPSGELYFFVQLLWYFPNKLDLALHLYDKSKDFSELNYPVKDSLKEVWKDYLNTIDELLKRNPGNKEYYKSEKRSVFWIEYDMLYVELLKNVVYNFNLQKFSDLNIEGEFKRKGSKINSPETEIIFRAKRKPQTGYYLTFKSDLLFIDIKTDLSEIEVDVYNFDTIFGSYRLELKKDSAKIHKLQSFSSENISLVKSTNFLKIIEEMTSNYIINFEKITERYTNDLRKMPINFYFFIALQIKELDSDLLEFIKGKVNSNEEIWGKLEDYYQGSIQGFDLKVLQ